MNSLALLEHTRFAVGNGGLVLVLNTGATISPEAVAMLQALHSRSTGGIKAHLEVLAQKGHEKFMSTYYVGYGHKSIGDCGNATVFVEGVSMLVAKAIQDWPLYSGQEASTRYVDFSQQRFVNPLGTKGGEAILEAWRVFYLHGLEVLVPALKERFPRGADEKEAVYDKAINARAFDIMRSFLPAGATTNLAWTMNLRQFADELLLLRHHPLSEVRDIAQVVEHALLAAYPSSFSDKRYDETEHYNKAIMREYYYDEPHPTDFKLARDGIDYELLKTYRDTLATRPAKTELPKQIAECGTMQFRFLLDFGSFRDIQRHRAVMQRMPLLTAQHGFHEWYLSELPESLRTEAEALIAQQIERIKKLDTTPEIAQYYIAMGFNTTNRLTGNIHALTYLAELRSTRFVHPTLRHRAQQIGATLQEKLGPYSFVFHQDPDPDRFDVKRGEHDIVAKDA